MLKKSKQKVQVIKRHQKIKNSPLPISISSKIENERKNLTKKVIVIDLKDLAYKIENNLPMAGNVLTKWLKHPGTALEPKDPHHSHLPWISFHKAFASNRRCTMDTVLWIVCQ